MRGLGVTPTLAAVLVLVSDSSLGTVGVPVLPISAWRASGLQELVPRPPTTAALGALYLGAQDLSVPCPGPGTEGKAAISASVTSPPTFTAL